MHDGMHYDQIQGQVTSPGKLDIFTFSKANLLRHLQWELATDH